MGSHNGQTVVVGLTDRVVTNNATDVLFGREIQSPVFYAQDQQTFGGDTAWVRLLELDSDRARIAIAEEQSRDVELTHIAEIVGWLVVGN